MYIIITIIGFGYNRCLKPNEENATKYSHDSVEADSFLPPIKERPHNVTYPESLSTLTAELGFINVGKHCSGGLVNKMAFMSSSCENHSLQNSDHQSFTFESIERLDSAI